MSVRHRMKAGKMIMKVGRFRDPGELRRLQEEPLSGCLKVKGRV